MYEQLINQELKEEIRSAEAAERQRVETGAVDAAESARVLAEYVAKLLEKRLKDEAEEEQVRLINQMLSTLGSESGKDLLPLTEERRVDQLLSVVNTKNSAFAFQEHGSFSRPGTSLAQSSLFTGSDHEPPMFVELAKEIESADRIDLLVSFVKWSGIRLILEPLKKFTERGHLRIITTSYMGATDVKAIEELAKLSNTEIKVSYDTARTRLHAKSYMFYRESGFSTAYIGSSNLSRAAISSGLEWNVKITS